MSIRVLCWLTLAALSMSVNAGVYSKEKSTVKLAGIGEYKTESESRLSGNRKLVETKAEFDGEGVMGFAAKLVFRSGKTGELINLDERTIAELNHKDKEYSIRPIKKIDLSATVDDSGDDGEAETAEESGDGGDADSDIRIIRQEFRVEETGNTDRINGFNCSEYRVYWITESENVNTGERYLDSLRTEVWSTREGEADLREARDQEMAFTRTYMEAMGLDSQTFADDILGTNWLSQWAQIKRDGATTEGPGGENMVELEKIEGYPIVIDGAYFHIEPQAEGEEAAEGQDSDVDVTNPSGMLGRFAKKSLFGKKDEKPAGPQPAFNWRSETVDLKVKDFNAADLAIPANYRKVD